MATKFKKAMIIGASSGIGREVARQLAKSGCKVAAIARRKDKLDELATEFPGQILPYAHDVKRFDDVPALFQQIARDLDGLDLVIYCSGIMPDVATDEFHFKKDQEIIEINLLGAMAWIDQAAIRFEHTVRGTIVAIGSTAGERGRASFPAYSTSKAALKAYLEALRNRLTTKGVTVTTIKPGPVQTDMIAGTSTKGAMPVESAAEKIIKLAPKGGEHFLKITHAIIFWGIRNTPSFLFRRLKL